MAKIYYIHLATLWKIIELQIFKHFSIRRLLFTLLILVVYFPLVAFVFIGRLLDEIFFPGFKDQEIKAPIYIISNPRSGTTYMHRLLCLDKERYTYMLLYHTLVTSVTWLKLIQFFGKIDAGLGAPIRKLIDYISDLIFSGWKDIHPMGINQSEEDEGIWTFAMLTPALCLLTPFMEDLQYITVLDKWSDSDKKAIMDYYESSLKRFVYATGSDKQILVKSVLSSGRINMMMERFPDAKVVYMIRSPYKTVPSFISMFASTWKLHSPEIPDNSIHHKTLGQIPIDYYKYFDELKNTIPTENFKIIKYSDLVAQPIDMVASIYAQFNMELSEAFHQALLEQTSQTRSYRSKHGYTLEQYGFTKEEIHEQLSHIFEEFDFEV